MEISLKMDIPISLLNIVIMALSARPSTGGFLSCRYSSTLEKLLKVCAISMLEVDLTIF
jgi:hypothetical protein